MANTDIINTEIIEEELITTEERTYLFKKMKETLDEFEHHSGEKGINAILDTWIENKANLICTPFKYIGGYSLKISGLSYKVVIPGESPSMKENFYNSYYLGVLFFLC